MKLLTGLALLGMVDSIESDYLIAELSDASGNINFVEMPIILIPCNIKEGDFFHIRIIDGVSEIRCGEPQE